VTIEIHRHASARSCSWTISVGTMHRSLTIPANIDSAWSADVMRLAAIPLNPLTLVLGNSSQFFGITSAGGLVEVPRRVRHCIPDHAIGRGVGAVLLRILNIGQPCILSRRDRRHRELTRHTLWNHDAQCSQQRNACQPETAGRVCHLAHLLICPGTLRTK
jgi:hypothetical protein